MQLKPGAKSPGSQTPGDSGTPWSPRRRRTLHRRGLEKLALNSGTTGGLRKMTQNASKKAHHRCHWKVKYLSLLRAGNVHHIRDELNLGHHPLSRMITGTFITVDELQLRSQRPSTCCCTPQACQQPCPGIHAESQRISQQLQLWETTVSSTPAPENLHDRHAGDVNHLVRGVQLRSNSFLHCLTQALSLAQQRACRRPTKNCDVQHSVDERI